MANDEFKGEDVIFIKGEYKTQQGTFKAITGYTDGYGAVCKIKMDDNRILEFTSDFFEFLNSEIQDMWNNDDSFELED